MRQRFGLALIAALATSGSLFAQSSQELDANDSANKPAEIEPLANSSLLLDLALAGNRLVAVGERGHVLLSDDRGATWRQAKSVPTCGAGEGACKPILGRRKPDLRRPSAMRAFWPR